MALKPIGGLMMRNYLIGILIGIALMVSATSFADGIESLVGKKIESQYPVTIDGKTLDKQAIVVDGSSYAPLRAIGDALDKNVAFDETIGVSLSSKEDNSVRNSTTVELPAPTPKPLTLDEMNALIRTLQTSISVQTTSIIGLSDERSATSKQSIAKWQAQLDALEAQKAELYPDATPTPTP